MHDNLAIRNKIRLAIKYFKFLGGVLLWRETSSELFPKECLSPISVRILWKHLLKNQPLYVRRLKNWANFKHTSLTLVVWTVTVCSTFTTTYVYTLHLNNAKNLELTKKQHERFSWFECIAFLGKQKRPPCLTIKNVGRGKILYHRNFSSYLHHRLTNTTHIRKNSCLINQLSHDIRESFTHQWPRVTPRVCYQGRRHEQLHAATNIFEVSGHFEKSMCSSGRGVTLIHMWRNERIRLGNKYDTEW